MNDRNTCLVADNVDASPDYLARVRAHGAGGTSAPIDSWFIRPLENHKEEKKENDDV